MVTKDEVAAKLLGVGYHPRPPETMAVTAMLNRSGGARVSILEGAPGTGKTYLGEMFAKAYNAAFLYYLCHHWTSDEEMHISIDVGRVAAGVERPEDAYKPGILLRAVHASHSGLVSVVLDEIDKAPQRAEALLLDFLQTGRVHGPRGEVWTADLNNVFVFITTNGLRPLMEPTLRRGFRVKMQFLPPNIEADVLRKMTGGSTNVVRAGIGLANAIRRGGSSSPSIQELKNLIVDLKSADDSRDVSMLIEGWLIKSEKDRHALTRQFGKNPESVLWGEFVRGLTQAEKKARYRKYYNG